MRGQSILSYALVVLASTAYAIPLNVGIDDLVERTIDVDARGLAGKVGFVDVGKDYVGRRQDAVDAAASVSSASGKPTPNDATPKPAKATTPADLPGCPAPAAAPKKNGTEPAGGKPKPSGTAPAPKAPAGTAPAAAKDPKAKPSGTATPPPPPQKAAAKDPKASGAAMPPPPPQAAANDTAPAPPKRSGSGAAGNEPKPLGCDPTKPQV